MKKFVITIVVVILVVMSIGVISFAQEEYVMPYGIPEHDQGNNPYILVITVNGQRQLCISSNPITVNTNTSSITVNSNIHYFDYNGKWNGPLTGPFTGGISAYEILYTNHDIMHVNGSVFFSGPKVPIYIFQNKTLLQPLSQSVTQNSRILLVCGVGILSLILSVGLFRKLYLYL